MVAQTVYTWDDLIAREQFPGLGHIRAAYADFQNHPEWDMPGMTAVQRDTLYQRYRQWLREIPMYTYPASLAEAFGLYWLDVPAAIQEFIFSGQVGTAPPQEPKPTPTGDNFFGTMRSWFIWATSILVSLALFCYGHWPLELLGDFFNSLSDWTSNVATSLYDAALWLDGAILTLSMVLNWDNIKSLLLGWLPGLGDLVNWFSDWAKSVQALIGSWWEATSSDVLDWIYAMQDTLQEQIDGLLSFDWFTAWWGNTTTTFSDWWDAARANVQDTIEAVVKPVRDVVNEHAGAIWLLTSPGDTALRWFWDRLTAAIVRLW